MTSSTPKKDGNSQERIAGALGALFFIIPVFMNQKTEFTLFYMRQNFLIVLIDFVIFFLSYFVGALSMLNFVTFLVTLFLAFKAYSGEKFAIPYLYDYSVKVIKILKLDGFFSVK